MNRLVQPEILDTLLPSESGATGSRRDLRRLNRLMGNVGIMVRALRIHLPRPPAEITELGAGDGNFLFRLAKAASPHWPKVNATLLDRQNCVSPETLSAFRRLDWSARVVVTDVFDWGPSNGKELLVVANLFLHHFENDRLVELLGRISQQASLFVAIEPRRFRRPKLLEPLLWLIGCNAVTRHDAVASIRAGFNCREISGCWPDVKNWKLTERGAGAFSHLFVAQRRN